MRVQTELLAGVEMTADVSEDGVYRYELTRRWSNDPMVTWVMLNPSTADAEVDDPTIRRCMGFAHAWEAGGIRVVNLFALRATDPKQIAKHHAPIGDRNGTAIRNAISAPDTALVVAAWGASNPYPGCSSIARVEAASRQAERALLCLGTTKGGAPRHPLYVKGDTLLVPLCVEGGTDNDLSSAALSADATPAPSAYVGPEGTS